jgi:hypothetical protein
VTAAAVVNKEKTNEETVEIEQKKEILEKSFPQKMDKTGVQKILYYLSIQQVSKLQTDVAMCLLKVVFSF